VPWRTWSPLDYAAILLRGRPRETSKSAETLKRSRSLRTIVMLKSRLPVKTSLTRLAVPSNGTRSAREVDLEYLPDIDHAFTAGTRDHGYEP
jgi:hypothetical protein